MATEAPVEADKFHEDFEWEAQRDNFTQYYKMENKTLKDAAKLMSDRHHFFATPRQWERRIKAWDLNKYVSRQQRLDQFKSEGRDLIEVAQPGRRPRKYSGGRHLSVHDDRNTRRFAKRELSRSRSPSHSRSRSPSLGHVSRSSSPGFDMPGEEAVIAERTYNVDVSTLSQQEDHLSIPAERTCNGSDSSHVQAHVLEMQNLNTGHQQAEIFFSAPTQPPEQSMFPTTVEFDPFTGLPGTETLQMSLETDMGHLQGGSISPNFYNQPQAEIMDLSPTAADVQLGKWHSPRDVPTQGALNPFGPDVGHIYTSMIPDASQIDMLQGHYQQDDGLSMPTIVLSQQDTESQPPPAKFDQSVPVDFSMILEDYTNGVEEVLSSISMYADTQYKLELYKRNFIYQINLSMSSFTRSRQRIMQNIEQKQSMKHHMAASYAKEIQPTYSNANVGHPGLNHRYSLSGPVNGGYTNLVYQAPSRPTTPIGRF